MIGLCHKCFQEDQFRWTLQLSCSIVDILKGSSEQHYFLEIHNREKESLYRSRTYFGVLEVEVYHSLKRIT